MELCLGTVQFGMQYGIASKGRPAQAEAEKMLQYAISHGIGAIDTASAYGEAEKILGGFLKHADRSKLQIVTKIRPGALYSVAPENYYKTLKQNLQSSLSNLHINYVDGCLFHNAEYAANEAALEALARLKKDKLVKKTGISTYLPSEFDHAAASPHVDIIQIPYNLLDTRLNTRLLSCDKEIHARSVFLQGLLLMDEAEVPQKLRDARPIIQRLDSFCEYNRVTRTQALLNFVKTQPKIEKLVFGADNLAQLKQIITDFSVDVDQTALLELAEEFSMTDERIIMPNLWQGEYK